MPVSSIKTLRSLGGAACFGCGGGGEIDWRTSWMKSRECLSCKIVNWNDCRSPFNSYKEGNPYCYNKLLDNQQRCLYINHNTFKGCEFFQIGNHFGLFQCIFCCFSSWINVYRKYRNPFLNILRFCSLKLDSQIRKNIVNGNFIVKSFN